MISTGYTEANYFLNYRNWATIFAIAVICVLITSFGFLFFVNFHNDIASDDFNLCVTGYISRNKVDFKFTSEIYNISSFCYNLSGSQLLIDEEIIRRDNFVFQRFENSILLIMVVLITLSGVVLAGLQLLASYKLAMQGKGELSSGGEIIYGKDSISFRSSVVGLIILAFSFAFFLVFIIYVYDLKEGKNSSTPGMPAISPQVSKLIPSSSPGNGPDQQQHSSLAAPQPPTADAKGK